MRHLLAERAQDQRAKLRHQDILDRFGEIRCSRRQSAVHHNRDDISFSTLALMAILAGFEPATCPLGGGCSIQLSHRTAA